MVLHNYSFENNKHAIFFLEILLLQTRAFQFIYIVKQYITTKTDFKIKQEFPLYLQQYFTCFI